MYDAVLLGRTSQLSAREGRTRTITGVPDYQTNRRTADRDPALRCASPQGPLIVVIKMFHYGVFAMALCSLLVGTPAQRSPYLGSSDPGVLPMYLPEGTSDRFGAPAAASASAAAGAPAAPAEPYKPPQMHAGTLETEDVYNRVSEWPDQHKPFWYLNSVAIQKQREQQQQQQQQQQAAAQNANRSPFAAASNRLNRSLRQ